MPQLTTHSPSNCSRRLATKIRTTPTDRTTHIRISYAAELANALLLGSFNVARQNEIQKVVMPTCVFSPDRWLGTEPDHLRQRRPTMRFRGEAADGDDDYYFICADYIPTLKGPWVIGMLKRWKRSTEYTWDSIKN